MDWLQWFLTVRVVIAAIVVIGGAVFGALHLAGPATSSDGKFSVDVPAGWVHVTDSAATGGGDVLTLAAKGTNGIESHFIVHDFGKSIPLLAVEAGWQPLLESGQVPIAGNLGPLTSATLAGAPALTADYNGSIASGQIMIVDYGSKTYFIELTAYSSQFAKLRDGDFAAILASWRWH